MSREMTASNFMEALLQAALILGDRRREHPVNEIRILACEAQGSKRQLRLRCRITMEPISRVPPSERMQIVYPERIHRVS